MESINRFVRSISKFGTVIGGIFLFITAFLIVANVVARRFGVSIAGTYELVVLFIVIPVAFALFQTTLDDAHVTVKFLRKSLSPRAQLILGKGVWLVTLLGWGLITWASIDITLEKWTRESSEILVVPYLPFRLIWIFALIVLCIAAWINFCREGGGER